MDDSQGEGFGRLNPDGGRAAYQRNSAGTVYLAAEYQQPNHENNYVRNRRTRYSCAPSFSGLLSCFACPENPGAFSSSSAPAFSLRRAPTRSTQNNLHVSPPR